MRRGVLAARHHQCSTRCCTTATTSSSSKTSNLPLPSGHNEVFFKGKLSDADRPATAWERGSGIEGYKKIETGKGAFENEGYKEAAQLMELGYWEKALKKFEAVREKDGMKNDKNTLVAVAVCLLELGRYEEAKKIVGICSAVHAGAKGLGALKEQCEWGLELEADRKKESQVEETEMLEKKEKLSGFSKSDLISRSDEGNDLLNNLPLEADQLEWMRNHLGADLEKVGLTYDENKGRSIKAKIPFKKGQVIMMEKSLLFAPEYLISEYDDPKLSLKPDAFITTATTKPRPTKCSHCRQIIKTVETCSACGTAYCSTHCKTESKTMYHSTECKALQTDAMRAIRDKLTSSNFTHMWKRYQLIIRATSIALQSGRGRPWPTESPWFNHLTYREGEHKRMNVAKTQGSDSEERDVKPTMYGLLAMVYTTAFLPVKFGGEWSRHGDEKKVAMAKEIGDVFDKTFDMVKTNCVAQPNLFDLTARTHPEKPILPFLSMLNHSCLPNAEVKDSNGTLVATDDIKAGSEITVSYTPKNIPTDLKHHYLRKYHSFHCRCDYCLFKALDEGVTSKEVIEDVGAVNYKETRKFREEWNNPEMLKTSNGMLTKMGLDLQQYKYDKMLDKYPEEFREYMMQIQEQAMEALSSKPPAEVRLELQQRKERVQRLEALGLTTLKASEEVALGMAIEGLPADDVGGEK